MAPRLAALLALLALALAAGCGDDERDAIESYIERANAVQTRYAAEFGEANKTYARFSEGELPAQRADIDLTAAEQALRKARAQLARIDPPPAAAELHRRLLRVFELNADFAGESTALARYLPPARRVLRRVGASGEHLTKRLKRAETPEAQAAALGRYARAIGRRYDALYELRPPPVLLGTHRVQLARLSSSSRLARQLRGASQDRDAPRVARLLLEFRRVSRRSDRGSLTRRAVREYSARYEEINRATAAMRRAQNELEQRLG